MIDTFEKDPESEVRHTLSERRKKIENFEDLTAFLKDVSENCNIGYGSAAADYIADKFGITGFQASCILWEFINGWTNIGKKTGAKILDYDKMLFPQYDYAFEKVISKACWEALQKEAKKLLETSQERAALNVVEHWQSIVDGNIPFGYTLKNE